MCDFRDIHKIQLIPEGTIVDTSEVDSHEGIKIGGPPRFHNVIATGSFYYYWDGQRVRYEEGSWHDMYGKISMDNHFSYKVIDYKEIKH